MRASAIPEVSFWEGFLPTRDKNRTANASHFSIIDHFIHYISEMGPACKVTLQISPPQCMAFWRDLDLNAYLSEFVHLFMRES